LTKGLSRIIYDVQPHLNIYRWNKTINILGTCTYKSK